ncbi:unnamed protein product, partial [Phaeothamnion confervicola]
MQEAKLTHARGQVHRALLMLEPVEMDAQTLRAQLAAADAQRQQQGGSQRGASERAEAATAAAAAAAAEERSEAARRLLLTTGWMVEAGQKHGQAVIDRFRLAIELQPTREKSFFNLGQYMDLLFRLRLQELERQRQRLSKSDRRKDAAGGAVAAAAAAVAGAATAAAAVYGWEDDEPAHRYVLDALSNYTRGLRHGSKYIFQSMPRLLTLWFDIGALRDTGTAAAGDAGRNRGVGARASGSKARGGAGGKDGGGESALRRLQAQATQVVQRAVQTTPPYLWYTCLPQLTSRVGHPSEEVAGVIVNALAGVLWAHPQQALWHLGGLAQSRSAGRREVGRRIMAQAQKALLRDNRREDADCVQDSGRLFEELIALAEAPPPSERTREAKFVIGRRMGINRFIVPVQAALSVSLPGATLSRGGGGGSADDGVDGCAGAGSAGGGFGGRQ